MSVLGVVTVGTAAAAVNTHIVGSSSTNDAKTPTYQPSAYPSPTQTIYRVAQQTPRPTKTVIVTTEIVDAPPSQETAVSATGPVQHSIKHTTRATGSSGSTSTSNPSSTPSAEASPTPTPSHTRSSGSYSTSGGEDSDHEYEGNNNSHHEDNEHEDNEHEDNEHEGEYGDD